MTQVFDSLGWALLHSLWQGALAMLAVVAFRAITKNSAPSLRYNFQILCLFSCFAAFLVTFGIYQSGGEALIGAKAVSSVDAVPQSAALLIGASGGPQILPQTLAVSVAAYTPLLGVLWCLGFAVVAARYLTAYVMTQKLRHTGLTDVPTVWQNRFRTLVLNTGVTDRVRIFISDHVSGPLTIGFIKPVVLVPTGFLMGLPSDQIEAILLHELAHIRRYDYLVNLFQTAIKTALFFHPAIHYISNKIDIDREQACDDLAVAQSRNPHALIRGLAALSLQKTNQSFAMAADGGDMPLMDRLKRLVGSVEHQRRPEHLLMPLIATLLIGGIYLSTTSEANAHPEPKVYGHANADKQNYKFETKRLNGRNVTVKVTEDGRRWVLVKGTWTDVDASPEVLDDLPVAMPEPPQPPAPPKYKNGKLDVTDFDAKMNQFEIDMEYFEADLERYLEDNNGLSERDRERMKRDVERATERAQRQAERLQDQIDDIVEREVERALAMAEREQDMAEARADRAKAQKERADAQRKRMAEQRERLELQRERVKEQAKRTEKKREKHNALRETLYGFLIEDGYLNSRAETVTLINVGDRWAVNGQIIPKAIESKYCDLISSFDIKKNAETTITLKPGSTSIVSQSNDKTAKPSNKVTIGRHIHKNGEVHDPRTPKPLAPPQPTPPQPEAKAHVHKTSYTGNSFAPNFTWPTRSQHINAKYGRAGKLWEQTHNGIDLKGDLGAPIFASADGVVHLVTTEPKWGNRVVLNHSTGYQTLYGHMNNFTVSPGQYVKAGDVIGTVGSTGQSTGPHLHFEIRKDGQTLDPQILIK
ncbi:peptidoglycan DD-metalloendopeptidase family protein [Litorimonas sp. RW-G-Af-16]|uniref:peptidoglycan DD-metalloendopeptidase family protein n=1 Tax=Litorimonas sp. RW-G-Af-16 TaxID=3241168 RepID=UPI00390C6813